MKPMNFPARKLERQLRAKAREEGRGVTDEEVIEIGEARMKFTKKNRSGTR